MYVKSRIGSNIATISIGFNRISFLEVSCLMFWTVSYAAWICLSIISSLYGSLIWTILCLWFPIVSCYLTYSRFFNVRLIYVIQMSNIASPAIRIKFIQAAKEGKIDVLKKYIGEGISCNSTDVSSNYFEFIKFHLCLSIMIGIYFTFTVYCITLGISARASRSY